MSHTCATCERMTRLKGAHNDTYKLESHEWHTLLCVTDMYHICVICNAFMCQAWFKKSRYALIKILVIAII